MIVVCTLHSPVGSVKNKTIGAFIASIFFMKAIQYLVLSIYLSINLTKFWLSIKLDFQSAWCNRKLILKQWLILVHGWYGGVAMLDYGL